MFFYNEPAIAKLILDFGINRLQAIRMLEAQEAMRTRPNPYPLGKTSALTEEDYEDWARRHPDLAAAHKV
jgi:hypothetical protein